MTRPSKHASDTSPESNTSVVKTPEPAGIDAPSNEKPITPLVPAVTINPLFSAAPPDAPDNETPLTPNWKP